MQNQTENNVWPLIYMIPQVIGESYDKEPSTFGHSVF